MTEADEVAAAIALKLTIAPNTLDEARAIVRSRMDKDESEQMIDNVAWALYQDARAQRERDWRACPPAPGQGPWWLVMTDENREIAQVEGGQIAVWNDPRDPRVVRRRAFMIAACPDLLKLAEQYATECGECAGTGITVEDEDCEDCRFIRVVIAKAKGRP